MRPSLVLVGLLGGSLAVLGLAASAFPEAGLWWWLPFAVVGPPAVVDLLLSLRSADLVVERRVSPLLTQGASAAVTLVLSCARRLPRSLRLFDGIPAAFTPSGLPLVAVPRGAPSVTLEYAVIPKTRGVFSFGSPWIDEPSPLGLWIRRRRPPVDTRVRVFPDRGSLGNDVLDLPGSPGPGGHHVRRRGVGLEFHQLREYRQGDLGRMIDGKATSRSGRLVVREMQEEQDQSVVFLLDTGYRMTDQDRGVRHFDRALGAVLSLATVALKQGDRVGVMTWGPDARWVPPTRGPSAFSNLVEKLYDVDARPEASSPTAALRMVLPRLDRRTLILLVTNFREEDGEDLAPLLPLVRAKHLLVTVWLREPFVTDWVRRVPQSLDEALETMAATDYETTRVKGRRRAEAQGVLTLDITPEHLRGALLGEYWRIKRRGLL